MSFEIPFHDARTITPSLTRRRTRRPPSKLVTSQIRPRAFDVPRDQPHRQRLRLLPAHAPHYTENRPFRGGSPHTRPFPGAHDRHHRHPGQRYKPPDPAAQAAAFAAQQADLREQKTRMSRFMTSTFLFCTVVLSATVFAIRDR
ncbi:hypothetical protein B0H17DRAFT_1214055 [Mycena rosella]|uniref:Uncharacterized protein n=1 Tax=Mycena rosella TaxID=1033263 RepID=A0AAD7CRC2_MYCRO|nr:hypothetical protein B0H17DRAFT_1214055 [Mycena rosella]